MNIRDRMLTMIKAEGQVSYPNIQKWALKQDWKPNDLVQVSIDCWLLEFLRSRKIRIIQEADPTVFGAM